MEWLLTKIADLLAPFFKYVTDVLGAILNPLIVVFTFVFGVLTWIQTRFILLKTKLLAGQSLYTAILGVTSDSIAGILPEPLQPAFAFVNYAMPLTECLIIMAMLIPLLIISHLVRFIKGWIPTYG